MSGVPRKTWCWILINANIFSLIKEIINPNTHFIRNIPIENVDIFFYSKLNFQYHVKYICNKALKTLGFIKRSRKDFTNVYAIKALYISFVRSSIENCSCVWSPYYQIHINKIERVQNRFLRYLSFKLRIPSELVRYDLVCSLLNIQSLRKRRFNADVILVYKLCNNLIDCPELLLLINFHAPQRQLRIVYSFGLDYHRTLYGAVIL